MHSNRFPVAVLLAAMAIGSAAQTAMPPEVKPRTAPAAGRAAAAPAIPSAPTAALKPCASVTVDPPMNITLGKSRIIRLDFPAARMVVGGQASSRAGRPIAADQATTRATTVAPGAAGGARNDHDGVADTEITLLSPTELYFLGKKTGSMNVVLQSADGRCVVKDIVVTVDPDTLQAKLGELMPEESGVKVRGAENAIVLTGSVNDLVKLDQVLTLAASYGDGKKVVNLLRVTAPQQVMLEVKIAEVSKTLLDKFGLDFSRLITSADGLTSSIISGIVGGGAGLLSRFGGNLARPGVGGNASGTVSAGTSNSSGFLGSTDTTITQNPDGTVSRKINISPGTISRNATLLGIDAQKKDGIIRVLAEPNIMAISGQSASFLSGGKIFIPVAQNRDNLGSTITLEEKEFGVGLKFTPTVLDGRINLKVLSEVSELSQTGTPFATVAGAVAILPSMATRRVDTTVQLADGQSFVVAGLIKNNYNGALDKFPGLGEVPVMGALFRSTEFQSDQTELMFVITPRLVKPLTAPVALPTDNHIVPSRADVHLMGKGEGTPPATPTGEKK